MKNILIFLDFVENILIIFFGFWTISQFFLDFRQIFEFFWILWTNRTQQQINTVSSALFEELIDLFTFISPV